MSEEQSEHGDPIHRYDAPKEREWVPPDMSGSSLEAIEGHIQAHIGNIEMVFHEIVSDLVHIDIHQVAPTEQRPYYTLISSGMSDIAMQAPEEAPDCKYAELMLCLP